MSNRSTLIIACCLILAGMAVSDTTVQAQDSRLQFSEAGERGPKTLATGSWTYNQASQERTYKRNELIHVKVSIGAEMISDGKINRNKTGYSDWSLPNWIKFYGNNLGADGLPNGVPEVRGAIDQQLQAEGKLQEKDSVKFDITCYIVDIRPNGNLILEGSAKVKNNEECWEYSVTGECQASDIKGETNTITSDKMAKIDVIKREAGSVRDSYRRGWAMEWLDKWAPF